VHICHNTEGFRPAQPLPPTGPCHPFPASSACGGKATPSCPLSLLFTWTRRGKLSSPCFHPHQERRISLRILSQLRAGISPCS
jgi:hypothetical protein